MEAGDINGIVAAIEDDLGGGGCSAAPDAPLGEHQTVQELVSGGCGQTSNWQVNWASATSLTAGWRGALSILWIIS